ncbi:MAG: N-6 DNA methylase [Bacteroidales bacterium]|nr:N-6 DNA methylase [Bacteroidales bacterium]
MNTETLRQIFKSPFDYTTYSREIVHRLFGCHDVASRPEWLDTNAEGDQSFFIGQMDDADHRLLGFFYTRVADGGDVRRKRVGLRKLISPYLKYDVDGAIAVFDDGRHWRLSYICDLKEGSTSAKRFSYILGDENGQYKTPLERLEKVARLNGRLTLSDLRESFSVDALSDEFFDEYHLHYDRIVANLTQSYRRDVPWRVSADGTSDTRLHDYVKKMMGRIVFLHFLQKKGWLNDNPTFLRDLFLASPHQADFLEQVLEPLFFGIFNTEPEQRENLFVDEQWDKSLLRQWEHLPYLNGGLFERDEVDKMNIKLPASLFNDLFTFLASYNFTVDENDPDDAEIGVDPEMLGKIFESLLEDNKAKGAFYTPKEIVRYMCKESLIAYLGAICFPADGKTGNICVLADARNSNCEDAVGSKIRTFVETHEFPDELEPYRDILDRALREVKICDPAIGSGAFPMGLLNELWRCREAISTSSQSRAALKREIIENNIYGVDIERGAIDIARLRFWLSIVVDSEKPQALPNFDYKFMQGNSLIESFEGVDLSSMMSSDGQHSSLGKGKQKAGVNQLGIEFASTDTKRNLQLMLREYFSLTDHVKKTEARRSINDSVKRYIRQQGLHPSAELRLSSLDPSANQEFFLWHTWFKEIFDKGGFDIVVGNPPYGATINEGKDFFKSHYLCTEGKYEIYKFFFEHATNICAEKGIIAYITPDTWQTLNYFKKMRKLLFERCTVISLSVSLYCIFRSAMVDTMVSILRRDKEIVTSKYNLVQEDLITSQLMNFSINNDYIISSNNNPIIQKIEQGKICLSDIAEVWQGLIAYAGKNQPRIWTSNTKETVYHRKLLYGRDISKYAINWSGEYLKYGEWLHRPRPSYIFDNEKLLVQRIRNPKLKTRIVCTYDNSGYINGTGISNIILMDKHKGLYSLKCLLGIMNSKLVNYWFSYHFVDVNIKPEQLRKIPLPNSLTEQSLVLLVDKILSIKHINPNADTSSLEREIDGLVYGLYGLTEEEVKVVEGK